jgi:hypothetical protein
MYNNNASYVVNGNDGRKYSVSGKTLNRTSQSLNEQMWLRNHVTQQNGGGMFSIFTKKSIPTTFVASATPSGEASSSSALQKLKADMDNAQKQIDAATKAGNEVKKRIYTFLKSDYEKKSRAAKNALTQADNVKKQAEVAHGKAAVVNTYVENRLNILQTMVNSTNHSDESILSETKLSSHPDVENLKKFIGYIRTIDTVAIEREMKDLLKIATAEATKLKSKADTTNNAVIAVAKTAYTNRDVELVVANSEKDEAEKRATDLTNEVTNEQDENRKINLNAELASYQQKVKELTDKIKQLEQDNVATSESGTAITPESGTAITPESGTAITTSGTTPGN